MDRVIRNPASNIKESIRRLPTDLLVWLVLVVFILGSMVCFGQLALLMLPIDPPADTLSRVVADYHAWVYDKIPAINSKALIADIIKDQKLAEPLEPTIVGGIFWPPPTTTAIDLAAGIYTITPVFEPTNTNPAPLPATPTPASTTEVTAQATRLVGPTATNTVTATRRPSLIPTQQPSATNTPQPVQATATATRTAAPVIPTNSAIPPTRTFTPIPSTPTPVTPTPVPPTPVPPTAVPVNPTPLYAPVHPIAENDGNSAPDTASGGCMISFGYLNDNPQEVNIPIGSRNFLTPDIQPAPQVQQFLVGRMFNTFQVVWTTPGPLTWNVNGQVATARWCK